MWSTPEMAFGTLASMSNIWPKQIERLIDVKFQLRDFAKIDAFPENDGYWWDVARPAVDAAIAALEARGFQRLDDPSQQWNTEMEVWMFHVLFYGWSCRIEVEWSPEGRNDNRFVLTARFRRSNLLAFFRPWSFREKLAALSAEIVEALESRVAHHEGPLRSPTSRLSLNACRCYGVYNATRSHETDCAAEKTLARMAVACGLAVYCYA
ncbi:MAG: hypothetical protein QM775_15200 [Pirellulales bacterium]